MGRCFKITEKMLPINLVTGLFFVSCLAIGCLSVGVENPPVAEVKRIGEASDIGGWRREGLVLKKTSDEATADDYLEVRCASSGGAGELEIEVKLLKGYGGVGGEGLRGVQQETKPVVTAQEGFASRVEYEVDEVSWKVASMTSLVIDEGPLLDALLDGRHFKVTLPGFSTHNWTLEDINCGARWLRVRCAGQN